jgi:hypothetical protein
MRTTITLDDDVAARLQHIARERRISFKEAVNDTLRAGLGAAAQPRPYRLPTYPMGTRPGVDLDRALQLDAALEDEETVRQLELRK